MISKRPVAFARLLERKTVNAILEMPALAQPIADRWALGWPQKTKAHEAGGRLLALLASQYELEREALDQASGAEYSHLADHEKLALLGPPPGL